MKKMILVLTMLLITSFCIQAQSGKSRGVPAYPFVQKFEQPDGSIIKLKMRGDAVFSWYETEDGSKVLRTMDKWFTYATLDDKGYMIASNNKIGLKLDVGAKAESSKKMFFNRNQIAEFEDSYFKVNSNRQTNYIQRTRGSQKASANFPTLGKKRSLMILAEFSNVEHVISASKFHDIMNKVNYNGTGSFRDYYLENSYGKFDVTTDIISSTDGGVDYVWLTLPHTDAYYGSNTDGKRGQDVKPGEMIRDAIAAADAKGFDFSKYDQDADGYVDNVMVIHSGFGEEAGASTNAIWSHRFFLEANGGASVSVDGVKVNDYITFPELAGKNGDNSTNIGVLVHEFGHALGLPDYYDTDEDSNGGKTYGLGRWDVMSGGSWNNGGITPAQHNAFSKYLLKWVDLPVLNDIANPTSGEIILKDISTNVDGAYMIKSKTSKGDLNDNDYYVIENRQQTKFNSRIPHHGMLVYHIDLDHKLLDRYGNLRQVWGSNMVNNSPQHMCMMIVSASNSYTASQKSIPFPGTMNVTALSDFSTPNLINWDGINTNVFISNIVETADGLIKFDFSPNVLVNLNLSTVFSVANKAIDLRGSILKFKSISVPVKTFQATVNDENKCVIPNFDLGTYNITLVNADRNVNGEMIYFDNEYYNVNIGTKDAKFSFVQAKTLKVILKNDNKLVDVDYSNTPITLKSAGKYDVEGILNRNGICAFKNFKGGRYNVVFGLESAVTNINGKETEIFFNTLYEDIIFKTGVTSLDLTQAMRINFTYSYNGKTHIKNLEFLGDKISIKSSVEENNRTDLELNENGICKVANLPYGEYTILAHILDKTIDIDTKEVFLSFDDTYKIKIESSSVVIPLRLKSFNKSKDLKVFPNPTRGYTQIEAKINDGAILRVYDMTGLLVIEKTLSSSDVQNGTLHGIDLSGLNAGIYNILIIDGDNKLSKRIVKQ